MLSLGDAAAFLLPKGDPVFTGGTCRQSTPSICLDSVVTAEGHFHPLVPAQSQVLAPLFSTDVSL